MSNYYERQLMLVLKDFVTNPESNLVMLVHSDYEVTKHLTVNLESIPEIRRFLDKVEKQLVTDLDKVLKERP